MRSDHDDEYVAAIHSFLTLFRYLRHYSRHIHQSGQSGRQLSALRFLQEHGPATMGTLSSYLYINLSSTTELVSKLEERALAQRKRSSTDNRVVEVELTPAGRALSEAAELGGIPLLRERLRGLSDEELRDTGRVLRRLNELLDLKEDP